MEAVAAAAGAAEAAVEAVAAEVDDAGRAATSPSAHDGAALRCTVKYTLRALLAVGVLAGFYVVGLAVVVALGCAGYRLLTVTGASGFAGGVWILAVVVVIAVGRGIFARQKRADPDPGGLLLSEDEQPELWREVRELAGFAETGRPTRSGSSPARTPPSRRRPSCSGSWAARGGCSSAPLCSSGSPASSCVDPWHELGHYSGRHTTLGALTYRGKEAIGRVLTNVEGSFVRKLLELYGRLYLAVSQTVNRRQELEADRLSAELAGPATAAEALQQTEALDPAWRVFLDRYVAPGEDVGCRPRDLFYGFRRFVADPERAEPDRRGPSELGGSAAVGLRQPSAHHAAVGGIPRPRRRWRPGR